MDALGYLGVGDGQGALAGDLEEQVGEGDPHQEGGEREQRQPEAVALGRIETRSQESG
jgi:hypothetical protein